MTNNGEISTRTDCCALNITELNVETQVIIFASLRRIIGIPNLGGGIFCFNPRFENMFSDAFVLKIPRAHISRTIVTCNNSVPVSLSDLVYKKNNTQRIDVRACLPDCMHVRIHSC